MEPQWYYAQGNTQHGPVPESELKARAERGDLRHDDLVWRKGMTDWLPAAKVKEIWPASSQPMSLDDAPPPVRGPSRYAGTGAGAAPPAVDWDRVKTGVMLHARRVFTWDLRAIVPTEDEREKLENAGIYDESAQRYAVWRRSVLWFVVPLTALAGLFSAIRELGSLSGGEPGEPRVAGIGVLLSLLIVLSVCALPFVAAFAAQAYNRPRASQRILLIGGAISFLVPILVALAPAEWWVDFGMNRVDEETLTTFKVVLGVAFFLRLMPAVLSLLPGLCRACVRTKTLLPTTIAPGWALLAGAPFQLLLSLVAFILIYQVASNFFFILGIVLLIGAPLLYLLNYRLLIRPLTRPEEVRAIGKLQGYVALAAWGGFFILLIFMFTTRVMGRHILGFDSTAFLRPWSGQLHAWWIEYVGRSLFMTVLFCDLLLRMNLAIWRTEKEFNNSPAVADHDRLMANMSEAIDGRPAPKPGVVDGDGSIKDAEILGETQ